MNIGLLTRNPELSEDLVSNIQDYEVTVFRNMDSLDKNACRVYLVDFDEIGTSDSAQFYLSKLRKKIHDIPVILIMRVNTVSEIDIKWFYNDFILYPFRKGEVRARIIRLLGEQPEESDNISAGNLHLNLKEYSVYLNNEKIDLTYKEFELMRLFLQNRGVVFSRKDVLSRIWGMEYIGGTRTVDVHIRRLRSKIGVEFSSIIETVRNVGYRCKE